MSATTTNAGAILQKRLGNTAERLASLDAERLAADVAAEIYDARLAAHLSQKQLADRIGTQQSVISRLEAADYEGHSLSMLRRIATAVDRRVVVRFEQR